MVGNTFARAWITLSTGEIIGVPLKTSFTKRESRNRVQFLGDGHQTVHDFYSPLVEHLLSGRNEQSRNTIAPKNFRAHHENSRVRDIYKTNEDSKLVQERIRHEARLDFDCTSMFGRKDTMFDVSTLPSTFSKLETSSLGVI